jgi:hypothetical protein
LRSRTDVRACATSVHAVRQPNDFRDLTARSRPIPRYIECRP